MPTSASFLLLRTRPARTAPAPAVERRDRPPAWRRKGRRLLLGGPDEPWATRPLLWLLLLGTAALYLVDLTSSGYAKEFYAAAVKSGTESLRAWLFGSLDAGNAITVDKPPASLWVMVLFARVLGFLPFSLLLPQALMGVGAVAALHATVKRWAGAYAGLVAGALLALTPVAALMFRFDNPDAMLVLLMTLAAYAVVRAVDAGAPGAGASARTGARFALRWMLVAGALIGVAFLTKMAQGVLVLPAFGVVVLVVSPLRLRTRVAHLLAATGAMVVAAGWYVALVELWPASARPYIGGSTDNSLWELALGYNGLGRLLGGSAGNGGGGGFGGTAGLLRLVNSEFATQISWLLPAALVALVAGLVVGGRPPAPTPPTRTRAALLLWGAWLVVTAVVFSFMSGTIHPYYSVALAPAIAAVIAVGGTALWRRRDSHAARASLAVMITATAVWGFVLLRRDTSGWMTWLAWTMLVGGVLGALVLAVSAGRLKRWAVAGLLVGTLSALAGTASFTAATVATGHTGSTPTAGPSVVATASGSGGGGQGGPGGGPLPDGTASSTEASTGQAPAGDGQAGASGTSATSTELTDLLDATSSRWSAAVVGDQSAAQLILASSTAVMAIGGWSGSDASPTLAQFQAYVAAGDVTYVVVGENGGGGAQGGGDSVGSQITTWVEAHFTSTTVGGTTVYDLTAPTS